MQEEFFFLEEEVEEVIISLAPEYYNQVANGEKRTEYRRGAFIAKKFNAFVYCTSPMKCIGMYVKFAAPLVGSPDQIADIKEKEAPGSRAMMLDWFDGRSVGSAALICEVILFEPVDLERLRLVDSEFHPPQNFLYLSKKPRLREYLEKQRDEHLLSRFDLKQ